MSAVENLVIFAPLVLTARALSITTTMTAFACALYFWSRLTYVVVYTLGIPVLRTLSLRVNRYLSSTEMVRRNSRPSPLSQTSVIGRPICSASEPSCRHSVSAFGTLNVAPGPATEIEDRERRIGRYARKQRANVLADVMVARTAPERLGVLVVMFQREVRDSFQVLWTERPIRHR